MSVEEMPWTGLTESTASQRDGFELDGRGLVEARGGQALQHRLGQQQRREVDASVPKQHVVRAAPRLDVVGSSPDGSSHVSLSGRKQAGRTTTLMMLLGDDQSKASALSQRSLRLI